MKEPEFKNKVSQKLGEFESLENIQPSADWNSSLMSRLDSAKTDSSLTFSAIKFVIIALLIVLINVGFILNALINDPQKTNQRNSDLQTISKELLINPNSINN